MPGNLYQLCPWCAPKTGLDRKTLPVRLGSPFVQLSCEIEGHPLGGGMLKLEPREASQIALPGPDAGKSLTRSQSRVRSRQCAPGGIMARKPREVCQLIDQQSALGALRRSKKELSLRATSSRCIGMWPAGSWSRADSCPKTLPQGHPSCGAKDGPGLGADVRSCSRRRGERTILGGLKNQERRCCSREGRLGPVMAVSCKGAMAHFETSRTVWKRRSESVPICTSRIRLW
jgi:hypothetical protein